MENNEVTKTPQQEMGVVLRKIREENGWSITQVSEQFHITEYSLEKIESGEKDKSKSDYYQRLYIIRFLKRVNQYNEKNKQLLEDAYPNNIEESIRKEPSLNYSIGSGKPFNTDNQKSKIRGKNKILNILAFVLIILIIGVSAFYTIEMLQSRTKEATSNPTTLLESTTLKPETVVEKKVQPTTVKAGKLADNKQTYTISSLPKADEYKLTVNVSAKSYIEITDKKTKKTLAPAKVYNKGDKIEITVDTKNDIQLNLGYAAGVKITINDQKLDASDYPKDQIFVTIKNEVK